MNADTLPLSNDKYRAKSSFCFGLIAIGLCVWSTLIQQRGTREVLNKEKTNRPSNNPAPAIPGNATTIPQPTTLHVPNAKDFQLCKQINHVPLREDQIRIDVDDDDDDDDGYASTPFSLRSDDFQRHHSEDCQTSSEILNAVKYGHREWPVEARDLDELKKARLPSTFIPHECHIPTMEPTEMCNVLNKFSHVLFAGDSLSRHILEAFITGLSNEFAWNGMLKEALKTDCPCDGQYSEADECRQFKSKYFIVHPDAKGICPYLANGTKPKAGEGPFLMRKISKRSNPKYDKEYRKGLKDIDCAVPGYKGMLLILQGGMHFHMDPQRYIEQFLEPLLQHDAIQTCAQRDKLFLIWQDHGSQSSLLDAKYPHQNAANTTRFNQRIHNYLDQRGLENVPRIDWMNITKLSQTSDGLHGLMNVNYFKAQYIARLADSMATEERRARFRN